MGKKFCEVAMVENNPRWNEFIKREKEIYSRPDDVRSPFGRDYTRVLHSLAYRRLKHKTQVFFNAAGNDHICTRIEHVAHVESVGDTISNYLGLNCELTKAIALSHDLGHAPFGHHGERVISKWTEKYFGEKFWHEKNGVYFVDNIELLEDNEKILKNLNLTYAVRDGIISHCGEVDQNAIKPRKELIDLYDFKHPGQYQAATWEGCVVKLSDKIAYLGRDIEDAIRLGYLEDEQQDILREIAKVSRNKVINTTVIMHGMIIDLCENSDVDKGLCLSENMSELLNEIKKFNYTYIYKNERFIPFMKYSELILNQLFERLLSYYRGTDTVCYLYSINYDGIGFVKDFAKFLVQYSDSSVCNYEWARQVQSRCDNNKLYGLLETEEKYVRAIIDYIAGMTDVYAIHSFEELLK